EGSAGPAWIKGDSLRLKMLIDNLIDNALRYTPSGGKVTVQVTKAEAFVVLTVVDNGPGIPAEERKLVLERFYRVLGSGEEGSGLGLAIVHEIALLHDARVEIDTPEAGTGVVFRLMFPVPLGMNSP
ncbi:MAG: ATP-binding protein, partial [Sulfurimicrobium sp.]|nr:ATP-binding protein [Sulfurimicrobium sp.]